MTGKPVRHIPLLCEPDIITTTTITYFLSPQGAETFPQLFTRGQRVIDEVRSRHANGAGADSNILLVTHGDIGKMIYAAYYGLPWEPLLTLFHFGNAELLLLSEDTAPENVHVFRCAQYNC